MEDREIWPDHAYIPGKTVRHADGVFDAVRKTALSEYSSDQLASCPAFRIGLRYLDAGFYWEAHEVFEPVWMVLPEASIERQFVRLLIQIANGYLKLEMGRPKAAFRLVAIARELLPETASGAIMGVEIQGVRNQIDSLENLTFDAL